MELLYCRVCKKFYERKAPIFRSHGLVGPRFVTRKSDGQQALVAMHGDASCSANAPKGQDIYARIAWLDKTYPIPAEA